MNDPNYDDFNDFHNEKDDVNNFIREVFEEKSEDEDPMIRNIECEFTENVLAYLNEEWEVELMDYPVDVQAAALDVIDKMKDAGENVSNTAGKIAFSVIPL